MNNLISAFKKIHNHEDLINFTNKYDLKENESNNDMYTMGEYSGNYNGNTIKVKHTWYDRSKTYQIREDGNRVFLEIIDNTGKITHSEQVTYIKD